MLPNLTEATKARLVTGGSKILIFPVTGIFVCLNNFLKESLAKILPYLFLFHFIQQEKKIKLGVKCLFDPSYMK